MIHKGNISRITITPQDIVDVVIGGSPCQDLSVAGKRAGLKHEANGDDETTRSGLFMEQIRIMKEMRELDKASGRSGVDVRCRWGVWENVPGALSSNQGEDFRIVLEEFSKIADPNVSVPRPASGKWSNSGCIMGDNYSVAWRIMDARYNGVPQRRRRISLVADFAGQSAPQILFDEEGMRWDFEASQEAWKRASGHAEHCSVGSSGEGLGDNLSGCLNPHDPESKRIFGVGGNSQSLYAGEGGGGRLFGVCYAIEGNGQRASHRGDGWSEEQVGYTLNSVERHGVAYAIDGNVCDRVSAKNGCGYSKNVSPTLNTQEKHAVVYDARGNGDGATSCTITGDHCNRVTDYTPLVTTIHPETTGALCANSHPGSYTGQDAFNDMLPVVKTGHHYIVRRLTPLECSRLQGLQDDWCVVPPQESVSDEDLAFWKRFWDEWMQINGKKPKTENQIAKWLMSEVSESAQYQMYGNGIAAPQWFWVCGRVIESYGGKKPTMASLFDGTGSFPWIWNSILEGEYTVWSSEVNPEAIRVSKYRIG